MSKSVLVVGAGGHAAVLIDILRQLECNIIGLVAREKPEDRNVFSGIPYYPDDDSVFLFDEKQVLLVNAIGSLPGQNTRFNIHQKFKLAGYTFMSVVSPRAIISEYACLAEGVQVMPGCLINVNASIGEGTIVNSGAIIEHDCVIGCHNHIAPGAVLCGSVTTADCVHIGTGAKVIQSVSIGLNTVVGAGATVTKNIASNQILYGAKPFLR